MEAANLRVSFAVQSGQANERLSRQLLGGKPDIARRTRIMSSRPSGKIRVLEPGDSRRVVANPRG